MGYFGIEPDRVGLGIGEYKTPVALEISQEYSVTLSEIRVARFEINPENIARLDLEVFFDGFLLDVGGATPTVELRLYDVGAPNVPQAGDLRATITTTTSGSIIRETVALTASDAPTSPGADPNDGTIYKTIRMYELRTIFTTGTAGDTMSYDTAGIVA